MFWPVFKKIGFKDISIFSSGGPLMFGISGTICEILV